MNFREDVLLAEWRAGKDFPYLMLMDEFVDGELREKGKSLVCLAGYALALVLVMLSDRDRKEMEEEFVATAREFAHLLLVRELAAEGGRQ